MLVQLQPRYSRYDSRNQKFLANPKKLDWRFKKNKTKLHNSSIICFLKLKPKQQLLSPKTEETTITNKLQTRTINIWVWLMDTTKQSRIRNKQLTISTSLSWLALEICPKSSKSLQPHQKWEQKLKIMNFLQKQNNQVSESIHSIQWLRGKLKNTQAKEIIAGFFFFIQFIFWSKRVKMKFYFVFSSMVKLTRDRKDLILAHGTWYQVCFEIFYICSSIISNFLHFFQIFFIFSSFFCSKVCFNE